MREVCQDHLQDHHPVRDGGLLRTERLFLRRRRGTSDRNDPAGGGVLQAGAAAHCLGVQNHSGIAGGIEKERQEPVPAAYGITAKRPQGKNGSPGPRSIPPNRVWQAL